MRRVLLAESHAMPPRGHTIPPHPRQVVIDDLRAELPGNDPASTAIKFEEMRAGQRASAEAAVKVRDHLAWCDHGATSWLLLRGASGGIDSTRAHEVGCTGVVPLWEVVVGLKED